MPERQAHRVPPLVHRDRSRFRPATRDRARSGVRQQLGHPTAVLCRRPVMEPQMSVHHMTRRGMLKGTLAAAAVVNYSAAAAFLSTYGPAPLDSPQPYD